MGTIAARYDASAAAYERWWAPVLRPSALAVLELVTPAVERALARAAAGGAPAALLDVGTGTGTLVRAAAARWPDLRVSGLDGSRGMLEAAAAELAAMEAGDPARIELVEGLADRLPFDAARFDAVVSSFVLQLVPHRPRALAEARRVLAPGGRIGYVSWLVGADEPFAPDVAFYDALDDAGVPDELDAEESRSGDLASAAAAAAQLRRAGFRDVIAREEALEHAHEPSEYLRFLEEYAERETFATLDERVADEVRRRTAERLGRLPAERFRWRAPIVFAAGTRPADQVAG